LQAIELSNGGKYAKADRRTQVKGTSMTPAKMFDGDLWMLASDAVKMAENAYKKGETDEREECAKLCEDKNTLLAWPTYAAAIRARGQA
jgi:hypothetical protein